MATSAVPKFFEHGPILSVVNTPQTRYEKLMIV